MSHLSSARNLLVRQVMAAMIQYRCFGPSLFPSPHFSGWSSDEVCEVLAAIPIHFFLSPRSIGRQNSTRHRSPLKQRCLRLESINRRPLGPSAYRDSDRVFLGLTKALEFYYWVGDQCGFVHDELTCREMSRVLARSNSLQKLWRFLRDNKQLVSTATVTSVITVLGEEGLAKQALAAFYRMKQLHCRPDTFAYNAVIAAFCKVGNMKAARAILERMELPGETCAPDAYTYTILISSYCKRSLQTGCRKAIRRRIWEANHMFRDMIFKGIVPDVVTYNCLIDGLCKTDRIERAHELFDDMLLKACSPNRVTYNSFIRYYSSTNQVDKAIQMIKTMVEKNHGVPTSSSYTPIIHTLCETGRAREASDFLVKLVSSGSLPREFTYKLVCETLRRAGKEHIPDDLCRKIEEELHARFRHTMKVKPLMNRKIKFAVVES